VYNNLKLAVLAVAIVLAGCLPEDEERTTDAAEPIRSVKTLVVQETATRVSRAFPTVLQPPQITNLAFERGGRLGDVNLHVGQRVLEGDVLLSLDTASLDLQLRQAEAALGEADSALSGMQDEATRQAALFERGVVAKAAFDRTKRALEQAAARAEQARRQVDLIADSRSDAQLAAPFDGVINSIEVQSFDTLQPGRVAATIYAETALQARVLVSFDVVSQLALGQQVMIRPADRRDSLLDAVVTEIADRAPAVSAFPVIVTLQNDLPGLRSGMAAEVLIDLALPDAFQGMPVPVSALATHMTEALLPVGSSAHRTGQVFVYRSDDTLDLRDVTISGLDESRMIVVEGLQPGDRVVTAGVPFLRPGQQVRLMDTADAQ